MPMYEASPEEMAEVLKHLETLGPEGGTVDDLFDASETLGRNRIRGGLFSLEKQGKAVREPRFRGRLGRGPDLWRAARDCPQCDLADGHEPPHRFNPLSEEEP